MNIIKQIKQTLSRLTCLIKPDKDEVIFDCGSFDITKRELITSIAIVAIMLLIGSLISTEISSKEADKNRMYSQALQLDTTDMFEYCMNTNAGNAFVYGELEAVDTVTYGEIEGEYLWIEKAREEYTQHTRIVEHTDSQGKTYTTEETYYTWDLVDTESKHSQKIRFCGAEFEYDKIEGFKTEYIKTVNEDCNTRYVYRGAIPNHVGTIFAELKDNTIPTKTEFYENQTIDEVLEAKISSHAVVLFWILWVICTAGIVVGFYYIDNSWLE